jgi:hypothetical protein
MVPIILYWRHTANIDVVFPDKDSMNQFNPVNFVTLLRHSLYLRMSKEEIEDTKGAIIIRISKKNRQHNDHKKKDKGTNNDLQNIHIKLTIE